MGRPGVLTPNERIERATRAAKAMEEFFAPALANIEADYGEKMIAAAASVDPRAPEMIARLANGIKVARQVRAQIETFIAEGQMAQAEKDRDAKIEEMTAPQKRLLRIAPR